MINNMTRRRRFRTRAAFVAIFPISESRTAAAVITSRHINYEYAAYAYHIIILCIVYTV